MANEIPSESGDAPGARAAAGVGPDAASSDGPGSARLTPYELVFAHAAFEEDRFPAILEEVEARNAETRRPDRFLSLAKPMAVLRELAPDEPGVDLFGQYGALLHQVWHFWRFGRPLYVLAPALAHELVSADFPTVGAWTLTPPAPAGHLQLPRHLFWARTDESSPPEPVDGFFWTLIGRDDPETPPYERVDLLLTLGMRPGRPGFGTVPVAAELAAEPLGHWADADARPGGDDFANILPGGELHDWHALVNEVEALKLASRIFWYAAVNPAAVGEPERARSDVEPGAHELPPSALEYRPIRRAPRG